MTQYSYSRVDLYERCPYHFKLRYIDKLTEIPDYTANNPLLIGNAMHTGIEKGAQVMLDTYFNSYPIMTDEIINESIKLEYILPKVQEFLSQFEGCELIHEYKIDTPDYLGYVDLIVKAPDGTCMVIDFKYSNHIKNYMDSEQMHIYRYYLEQEGFKVDRLAYLFVEKVTVKQSKNEDIYHYRKRLISSLQKAKVTFVPIEYEKAKALNFRLKTKRIEAATKWPKDPNGECFSCKAIEAKKKGQWTVLNAPDYLETIQENGEIVMALPKNERRNIEKVEKRVFWIYGPPFSGKTWFANTFPDVLMLNTDGNIKFVDAPFVNIADKIEKNGRITTETLAYDVLENTLSDLERQDHEFNTVVFDLLEDLYTAARYKVYEELGIDHESDNSFKAWDIVTNKFLSIVKRIINLNVENIIFISHEDISKDVTSRAGDKITSIQPNLREKVALKVAGMVDIVGRVETNDDDRRLVFKSKSYVFSGGRLPNLPVTEIELDYEELIAIYDEANKTLKAGKAKRAAKKVENTDEETVEETVEEKPTRKRRSRKSEEVENNEEEQEVDTDVDTEVDVEEQEETPTRKRRSRKKEDEIVEDEESDDETPPGESDSNEEPSEELPQRKRRERKPKDEEAVEGEKPARRRGRRGK